VKTYWFHDTLTGAPLVEVSPSACSGARLLNAPQSGSTTFQLTDGDLSKGDWQDLSRPWARTLMVRENNIPIYAGLIDSNPRYPYGTGALTTTHVELESFFGERYPFGPASYWANEALHLPGNLYLPNRSYRSVAAHVALKGNTGPLSNYTLPIRLPSGDEPGPASNTRTFDNHRFQTVSDIFTELRKIDGGPDIDFPPRLDESGNLYWEMRVGSTATPALGGTTVEVYLGHENSPATEVNYTRSGADQITGMFSIGTGTEVDKRVGGIPAGLELPPLIPARDKTQQISDDVPESVLAQYSMGAAKGRYKPTEQWEMKLPTEFPGFALEATDLGSTFRLNSTGDPFIPDGWYEQRFLGFSFDMTDFFTPKLQRLEA
jgi:hypothetical protein